MMPRSEFEIRLKVLDVMAVYHLQREIIFYSGLNHRKFLSVIKSLEKKELVRLVKLKNKKTYYLTDDGRDLLKRGKEVLSGLM